MRLITKQIRTQYTPIAIANSPDSTMHMTASIKGAGLLALNKLRVKISPNKLNKLANQLLVKCIYALSLAKI